MTDKACKHADVEDSSNREACSAPLCPLDEQSLARGIWYCDEDICRARQFARVPWVRTQKKMAKVKASDEFFFTVAMLNSIGRVSKGLKGANPDASPDAERQWLEGREAKGKPSLKSSRKPLGKFKTVTVSALETGVEGRGGMLPPPKGFRPYSTNAKAAKKGHGN